jgi:hypothetical protein
MKKINKYYIKFGSLIINHLIETHFFIRAKKEGQKLTILIILKSTMTFITNSSLFRPYLIQENNNILKKN